MQPNDAITPEFIGNLKNICTVLETKPEYILPVMFFESGCCASSTNANSSATGLIGFMGQKNFYGIQKYYGYTRDQFKNLTMDVQINYVGKYLLPYRGELNSVGNVYQAVFLPASLNYAKEPTDVICGINEGQPYGWAYRANLAFDKPDAEGKRKGYITVQDVTECAKGAAKGPRWDEINQSLGATPPQSAQ